MRKIIIKSITVLGKNSIIYGFGTIITRFINVLLLPFFTSFLSPIDYGVMAVLTLLGQVLQPLFSLGLGAGMGPCYFEGNDEDTKSTAVWSAFTLLLLSNSIFFIFGTLFSKQLSNLLFDSIDYAKYIPLSLGNVILSNLKIPLIHRLQFEEKSKSFVYISILTSLSTIFLNVVFVIFLRYGVSGMLIGQLLGAFFGFILFFFNVSRGTRFLVRSAMIKSLLHLGLPLVPSFAFVFILMNGNKYLLQWFSGLNALGVYSVGFSFGAFMNIFIGAFQTAWFPYFMSFLDKPFESKTVFVRILNYYVIIFGSLTILFFIFARSVVILTTQLPFHDAYKVIGFTALAYFFLGLFSLLLPPIYYNKKDKILSIIQGIACIPYILTAGILIRNFESLGAAISLSMGSFFMVSIAWVWIRKKYNNLFIPYNIKKNIPFAIYLIANSVIFTIDRNLKLVNELNLVAVSLASLLVFLIIWLKPNEKREIITLFQKSKSIIERRKIND